MRVLHYAHSTLPISSSVIAKVIDKKRHDSEHLFTYRLLFHRSAGKRYGVVTNQPITVSKYQITISDDPSFSPGDIIELTEDGEIICHISLSSNDNVLVINNHCNLGCINCPQVSRAPVNGLLQKNHQIIDLMGNRHTSIALSGGEPTLDISALADVLKRLTRRNKNIEVDILTNGITLATYENMKTLTPHLPSQTRFVAALYADVPSLHDSLTGCVGSFYTTLTALHTIASFQLTIELRFIINRINYQRLPAFIEFVYQHVPYIQQISLVGMEYSGFAALNADTLFISQRTYAPYLVQAIEKANQRNLMILIYNHQLCHLPPKLWRYCMPTISDWKTLYLEECRECLLRQYCGGFFSTSRQDLLGRNIMAITAESIEGINYGKN